MTSMHEIQHEILITKPSEKVVLSPEIGWAKITHPPALSNVSKNIYFQF